MRSLSYLYRTMGPARPQAGSARIEATPLQPAQSGAAPEARRPASKPAVGGK